MKRQIFLLAVLLLAVPSRAETIYVDDDGPADFNNIQDAINYSWHGDTIIVKPGMYVEQIYFNNRAITLTSENPNDPNIVASTTIAFNGGDVVMFDFGEGSDSVLTGFTIRDGAVFCYASSPTITKNVICGNGIYGWYDASPTISYNAIINGWSGIWNCHGLIIGNNISYNEYTGLCDCNGIISNNIIAWNVNPFPNASGGGLYRCDATISHNIISDNSADAGDGQSWGGGLCECNGEIYNNIIVRNTATAGGGLYNCNGTIRNNTIVENVAILPPPPPPPPPGTFLYQVVFSGGGGLYNCSGTVKNNIIAFNAASYAGGIYGPCNNSFNCLWLNEGGNFGGGAIAGAGDFYQDPLFADYNNLDYHLKSAAGRWDPNSETWVIDSVTSSCIDAGDPCDPIGVEPNPNGGRINMGVYGGTAEASKSPTGIIEPVCVNPPPMDTNGDCKIDFIDFAEFVSQWMDCGLDPQSACWE